MHRFGTALLVLGVMGVIVGLLQAVASLIRSSRIAFAFRSSSLFGPLLGGLLLVLIGAYLRERSRRRVATRTP